jgi:AAA+ superfamily predicted ATPase
MVEFQEDGTNFPSDAQFVKYVWKYVNKKGGPDRRFSDNPQYPVYRYAYITIKLGGDCVNFLVSNASAANEFANKYNDYISTQDLETEEGESHHDKKSCDDKKQSRVERSSYDNFKTAATNLYSYLKKMGNMDAVISALDEQEISIPDSIAFTINPKLAVVALIDVIKCYKGLGYKIDLSQPEGIGLAILAIRLLVADCNMVIDSEELLKSKGVAPAEKFIKSFDSAIKTSYDGDGFYVAEILRSGGVDDDVVNKYIVLLYRFALVLAKTDGVITQNESNWLANIMRFSNDNNKKRKEMVASNSVAGRSDSSRKDGNAIDQLNSLIGLDSVKNEVTKLSNFIKVQQLRQQKGLNTSPISYHCVFTGNPGTGKTTVARILSEIYRDLGILKNGHLVETDRSGLVAEYVGQTAVKTNKIIDSALDGVLFIDEAYSLLQGGSNDYGMEAVATLLKRMEDDRDRLIVILAGYSDDMKKFIESNPGLQSRFNRYIEFEDYTAVNLYDIFVLNARKYDYDLSDGAHDKLKSLFERAVSKKDKNFGNGRFARNILEKTLENQAMRLSLISNITEENLRTIEDDDIPDY